MDAHQDQGNRTLSGNVGGVMDGFYSPEDNGAPRSNIVMNSNNNNTSNSMNRGDAGSVGYAARQPFDDPAANPRSGLSGVGSVQRSAAAVPSYHFAIGSVETFERKLEQAQRELGIQPRDFIPVQYVSETSWLNEAAKLAPTLLLIGAWGFFMMRGMGGAGGGGGGMGGIFQIGKSKAKKITKEDVNGDCRGRLWKSPCWPCPCPFHGTLSQPLTSNNTPICSDVQGRGRREGSEKGDNGVRAVSPTAREIRQARCEDPQGGAPLWPARHREDPSCQGHGG